MDALQSYSGVTAKAGHLAEVLYKNSTRDGFELSLKKSGALQRDLSSALASATEGGTSTVAPRFASVCRSSLKHIFSDNYRSLFSPLTLALLAALTSGSRLEQFILLCHSLCLPKFRAALETYTGTKSFFKKLKKLTEDSDYTQLHWASKVVYVWIFDRLQDAFASQQLPQSAYPGQSIRGGQRHDDHLNLLNGQSAGGTKKQYCHTIGRRYD